MRWLENKLSVVMRKFDLGAMVRELTVSVDGKFELSVDG